MAYMGNKYFNDVLEINKKILEWIVISSGSEIRGENKDKGFIKPNLPIKILDNFKCFFLPC